MTEAPSQPEQHDTAEPDDSMQPTAPDALHDPGDPYDDPDWDGVQDPGANPRAVEIVEESPDA